jgi:3-dehydroquinate synthetase
VSEENEQIDEQVEEAGGLSEAPVGPEPTADEEVAEPRIKPKRQWVTLRGSSIDAHVGDDLLSTVGRDLKSYVSKPRLAALLVSPNAPSEAVESVFRSLTDTGFLVKKLNLPSGRAAASFATVEELLEGFARIGLSGDDVACAIGDVWGLSAASFATHSWCGGVAFDEIPLDPVAAVIAGPTPAPLDVPGGEGLVTHRGSARFVHAELDVIMADQGSDNELLARALFATSAIADSDKAFERLWDRTPGIVSNDRSVVAEQVTDCLKSRGKIISSTSIAVRQSINYGITFSRALRTLVGPEVPQSTLMAEAMRFAGRLSCAQGAMTIDDMLTQDELLDRLELGFVTCPVDADKLASAIRAERFRHSNKFMLELPRTLGRVRLAQVDEDMLREHVGAWCDSRQQG